MEIIEQFIKSKNGRQDDCEDGIFFSNDFAALIDGVTSKSPIHLKGESSGKAATRLIVAALSNIPRKSTMRQVINLLTDAIKNFYLEIDKLDEMKENPVNRAAASIVIFSDYHKEVWMAGDCQCLIDNVLYSNNKLIDMITANTRSFYLQAEILSGKSIQDIMNHDTGTEYIWPLLERQSRFQNLLGTEYSYCAIDGFYVPTPLIKRISAIGAKTIVFATDGYPNIYSSLAKSERYLAKLLHEDPLCFTKNKSQKGLMKGNVSFDDRAFLKIKCGP